MRARALGVIATAVGCLLLLACGTDDKLNHEATEAAAKSPFAHIAPQDPGGKWLAPAKNKQDLVREFRSTGTLYMVGVPLARLIAVAYGVHPRDVMIEADEAPTHVDSVVRPLENTPGAARKMLRSLIGEQLALGVTRRRTTSTAMVLGLAPSGVLITPSESRDELLVLTAGQLKSVGSTISQLVDLLRDDSKIPVIDETNLTGHYDYLLEWDVGKGAYAFIQSLGDIGLALNPAAREVEQLNVKPKAARAERRGQE